MHEETPERKLVKRCSPYDGNIHEGVMYTDHGFWDVARPLTRCTQSFVPTIMPK